MTISEEPKIAFGKIADEELEKAAGGKMTDLDGFALSHNHYNPASNCGGYIKGSISEGYTCDRCFEHHKYKYLFDPNN